MVSNILLSFDLEEFDIPEEYGEKIPEEIKLKVSRNGLELILVLLKKLDIKATFYTTAFFAEKNPQLIVDISNDHEIASHGYYHSIFNSDDIKTSKVILDKITNQNITGFRMPRLQPFNESLLTDAGYVYNSSLNPTYLPGRYNNFNKPRLPFVSNGIINLPASVTSNFRLPLFWISFKVFPFSFYKLLALNILKKDKYLNIYFHPWEFTDISKYKMPFSRERNRAARMPSLRR